MTHWSARRTRTLVALLTAALCVPTLVPCVDAQEATASIGVYTVPSASAAAFQAVIEHAVARLRSSSADRPLEFGVRLRRVTPGDPGQTVFVLDVEPARRGSTALLEWLIDRAYDGADRDAARRELSAAAGSAARTESDVVTVFSVSPMEALRERLEAVLNQAAGAPGSSTEPANEQADASRLESLKAPLWAAGPVEYELVDAGRSRPAFRWRVEVRNPSVVRDLNATVTVEFVNERGDILATGSPVAIQLEPVSSRMLEGQLIVSTDVARSVTQAHARVIVSR